MRLMMIACVWMLSSCIQFPKDTRQMEHSPQLVLGATNYVTLEAQEGSWWAYRIGESETVVHYLGQSKPLDYPEPWKVDDARYLSIYANGLLRVEAPSSAPASRSWYFEYDYSGHLHVWLDD